jgi:outer membrane protein assembly factor BamD|tara:strand:- start:4967 stop:5815 length:849 start_codon:yes stop_codon:yes gene_type:complete
MIIFIRTFLILSLILLFSCKNNKEVSKPEIKNEDLNILMIEAYQEGLNELENGYAILAAKKFNEAEILFPQSIWAPRSSLMAAYSYYSMDYYEDSINELIRFLKTYPNNIRTDYARYLLAINYYEQIINEKKDLGPILDAKNNFIIVKENFPDSDFALDAEYKLNLIEEMLASKEMYLAKYYSDKEKWIPAINRYKEVLKNYSTTIFVEEALHRLVEIHYKLGLKDESKKYASMLGYNYQSSEWYEKSYKIFNKNYVKETIEKNKKIKKTTLEKIKSLLSFK